MAKLTIESTIKELLANKEVKAKLEELYERRAEPEYFV